MAKVGFTFRESYYNAVKLFPSDEERGRFLLGLCEFAFEGTEPDFSGSVELEVAFECIREHVEQQMAESLRNSLNGAKSTRRRC